MMGIDGKRAYLRLNAAIQFTTPLTSNIDEAVVDADGYTVSLDDDSLRILFHKSTFPEFDLDKFTSIILKVASALYGQRDDECADDPYEVYDYLNDTYTPIYVSLPVSLIDPNFETDSDNSDNDDDSDDDDNEQQSNPDTQVAYLYSIDIPLCDWKAYQRIANAIGVPNAFPRKHNDDFDSHKSNNYGSYIAPKYSIFLDGDIAFIHFKELDLNFIASIMNPICDALLIKRGDYEITDIETGDPIDPSTITLKNVLDLPDGLITPSKKVSDDKPWRPSDSLSDKEKLFWNSSEKEEQFDEEEMDEEEYLDLCRRKGVYNGPPGGPPGLRDGERKSLSKARKFRRFCADFQLDHPELPKQLVWAVGYDLVAGGEFLKRRRVQLKADFTKDLRADEPELSDKDLQQKVTDWVNETIEEDKRRMEDDCSYFATLRIDGFNKGMSIDDIEEIINKEKKTSETIRGRVNKKYEWC